MSDILVRGKILKQLWKSDSNGYMFLSFSPLASERNKVKINKYGTVTLKGELGYLTVGEEYELKLKELETNNFGTSYEVLSCPSLCEIDLSKLTLDESKKILTTFTTENQANNILSAYPNFIEKVINEGKESIDVKKIHNVGDVYLSAYCRELNERYKYVAILNKYSNYELSVSECKLLYETYFTDESIAEKIEKEPYYVLIEVLKRSFTRADKIICSVRADLIESEQRCEAVIMDILHRNEEDGSSRLKGSVLWDYCHDYDNRLLPLVKDVCINSEHIYYNEETKDIALMSTYLGELKVSDWVKEKLSMSNENNLNVNIEEYRTTDDGFDLSDDQLKTLDLFCKNYISILMGFSGAGKTFSVKQLVKMIEDNNMSYVLLSPTGKASRVLAESTGKNAYTIHKKCYSNDIDTDVVIVDEFGMVGLEVMIMLINHCVNPNTRFVFVGDPAQIPSISLGKIFDDFIASELIPITMLDKVFRYKSNGSLFVATNVRKGKSFFEEKDMVNHKDNIYSVCDNYKFMEVEEENIGDKVIDEYLKLIKKGIKPQDILILAPQNVGDIGTYKLNNIIQSEVNPPKSNEKILTRKINSITIKFRVGDIVLNTKNDYKAVSYEAYMELKNDELHILSEADICDKVVVNGQTGIIREVLDDGLLVQFDEDLIFMNKGKLNQLLLGYSISTFKAQGSTCEYTINVVSSHHKRLLSRGLLYVADTRNKKSCIDIGSIDAYETALRTNVVDNRETFLLEMLKKDLTN